MTHLLCVYNGFFLSGFHGSSTNRLLLELPTNSYLGLSHYCLGFLGYLIIALKLLFAILIKNSLGLKALFQ